ncbi:hypothetical protein HOG21_00820 [bacterium]|nr:hypothetical protein [bacterium]
MIGNYKEYIKIITLLFSLDNYVSNSRIYNENNFLSLLLEKKPFEYEKIKELYFKDIE